MNNLREYIFKQPFNGHDEGDVIKIKKEVPDYCLHENINEEGYCWRGCHKTECLGEMDVHYCVRGLINDGILVENKYQYYLKEFKGVS